jgi:hypothetical protein
MTGDTPWADYNSESDSLRARTVGSDAGTESTATVETRWTGRRRW